MQNSGGLPGGKRLCFVIGDKSIRNMAYPVRQDLERSPNWLYSLDTEGPLERISPQSWDEKVCLGILQFLFGSTARVVVRVRKD